MATIKKDITQLGIKQIHYTVAEMEEKLELVDWLTYEHTYDLSEDEEFEDSMSVTSATYSTVKDCWLIKGTCTIIVPHSGSYYLTITAGSNDGTVITANNKKFYPVDGIYTIPLTDVPAVIFETGNGVYISKIKVKGTAFTPATTSDDGLFHHDDKEKLDKMYPAIDLTDIYTDLVERAEGATPAKQSGVTELYLKEASRIFVSIGSGSSYQTGVYDCKKIGNNTLCFDCWGVNGEYFYRHTLTYQIDDEGICFTSVKSDVIAISRTSETAKEMVSRMGTVENILNESALPDIQTLKNEINLDKTTLAQKSDIGHTHTSIVIPDANDTNFASKPTGILEGVTAGILDTISGAPVSKEGFGMLKLPISKEDAYARLLITESGAIYVNFASNNLGDSTEWLRLLNNKTSYVAEDEVSIDGTKTKFAKQSHTHTQSEIVDLSHEWADILNKPTSYTPSAHTHLVKEITDFPKSLKNPTNLNLYLNGTKQASYDGSTETKVDITPTAIGAAPISHSHKAKIIKDSNYTLTNLDFVVLAITSSYDISMYAPDSPEIGQVYTIMHHGTSHSLNLQFKVNIAGTVKDSLSISEAGASVTLVYGDDGVWYGSYAKGSLS